jgi:putative addiction module component (TIGR02574 family)
MSSSMAEVSRSALGLPASERAALIDRLFDSIDAELDPARRMEIEKQWAEESERRIDAAERGQIKVLDGPKALAKLRGSIQK